jgi:hypothetical protein
MAKKKNPAAVALGRLGGAKKVPKGLATMTDEQRRAISLKGVNARKKAAKKKAGEK